MYRESSHAVYIFYLFCETIGIASYRHFSRDGLMTPNTKIAEIAHTKIKGVLIHNHIIEDISNLYFTS